MRLNYSPKSELVHLKLNKRGMQGWPQSSCSRLAIVPVQIICGVLWPYHPDIPSRHPLPYAPALASCCCFLFVLTIIRVGGVIMLLRRGGE